MRVAVSFLAGLLFSFGLTLSEMTMPARVVGFLDFFGAWDPTLAFVMAGAITVYAAAVRLIPARRKKPLFADEYWLPEPPKPDLRLLLGAGIFGAGWGLAGVCPGPGLVALGTLTREAVVFFAAMAAAMAVYGRIAK